MVHNQLVLMTERWMQVIFKVKFQRIMLFLLPHSFLAINSIARRRALRSITSCSFFSLPWMAIIDAEMSPRGSQYIAVCCVCMYTLLYKYSVYYQYYYAQLKMHVKLIMNMRYADDRCS